jgi:hypothetical protein
MWQFYLFFVPIGERLGQKSEKEQPGNQETKEGQENHFGHAVTIPDAAA